ncbi:MAG: hypothetical protein WDM78_22025 [Puia sp.]
MTMEDGSMSMEREQLSQMASRQITFIDHLEKAMMRIEIRLMASAGLPVS